MKHNEESRLDKIDNPSAHDNIDEGRIISAEGGAT